MSLIDNERTKLTATDLNTAAGGLFTAAVIAPVVAATFGVSGAAGSLFALTLVGGVATVLGCSVGLHLLARTVPRGLKP